jgi:hypothetical protein
LANGGYIIKIRPIASGILVVPSENELINEALEGIRLAIPTPNNIARKIHKVRKRSRKLSFFLLDAGAQFVTDIILFYLRENV